MTVAVAPLFLVACGELDDRLKQRTLDYELSRPRIPAVMTSHDPVDHRASLRVDALLLADDEPVSVEVAVCGIRPDLPVSIHSVACFDNPELVTVIGSRLPMRWTPPDLSQVECRSTWRDERDTADTGQGAPTSCESSYPLRVMATYADGRVSSGHVVLNHNTDGQGHSDLVGPALVRRDAQLIAPQQASAGDTIELSYRIDKADLYRDYRWYVDAGQLLQTGVTRVQRLDGGYSVTDNALRIPDDYSGPLRVVVVVNNPEVSGDVAWRQVTVQVNP